MGLSFGSFSLSTTSPVLIHLSSESIVVTVSPYHFPPSFQNTFSLLFSPESPPPPPAGEVTSTRDIITISSSSASASAITTTTATATVAESSHSSAEEKQELQRLGALSVIDWSGGVKSAADYCSKYLSRSRSGSPLIPKIAGEGTAPNSTFTTSGEVQQFEHHQLLLPPQSQLHQRSLRRRAVSSSPSATGAAFVGQEQQHYQGDHNSIVAYRGISTTSNLFADPSAVVLDDIAASRKRKPGSPRPPLAPRRKAVPPEKGGARGRRLQAARSSALDMYSSYPTQGSSACRMVGSYQILETLGEGLTSKVKKGRDTRNGRVVALKVMFQQRDDMRRAVREQRFFEEVSAMTRCNNISHTVDLIEVLQNAQYPKRDGTFESARVLVLEYCVHGELFRLLSLDQYIQPLPSSITREYFRQLMNGIYQCHSLGVAHRDIKPQNLLVDSDFSLKIADFGFAAMERPHMLCNSIVGTHAYTAPEVLGGATVYLGHQADVWSAGIVLFRMVVGHLPMERADTSDWWFRALNMGRLDLFWKSHQDQVRFALPSDAKDLISRMLTPDPSKRIQVAQITTHSYLHGAQPSRSSLFTEMSHRFEMMRASNYSATSGTTAGSAPSSGNSGGARATAVATTIAQPTAGVARQHNAHPFYRDIVRSSGDGNDDGPPEMSADAAAAVTGGFMAFGRPRDVVKSIERALHDMGAEIAGVQRDGARTFRTSFKVSAFVPAGPNAGMDSGVRIVAKVYRILGELPKGKINARKDAKAPDLVVILRRKGGDYFRYGIVERRLLAKLTTASSDNPDISDISDISETSTTLDSSGASVTIPEEEHTSAGQDAKPVSPSHDVPSKNKGRSRRRGLFGRIFQ